MMDTLTNIDEKTNRLKKQREKVQLQQVSLFHKEAQKIFQTDFSADVALSILYETWGKASESQKADWKKRGLTFRSFSVQSSLKKPQASEPTAQPS